MPETFSRNVQRKLARYMAENPSTTAEQQEGMARIFAETERVVARKRLVENVQRRLAHYMAENPSATAEQLNAMVHVFTATEVVAERKQLMQDAGTELARFIEDHPPTTGAEARLVALMIDNAIADGKGPDYLLEIFERAEVEVAETMGARTVDDAVERLATFLGHVTHFAVLLAWGFGTMVLGAILFALIYVVVPMYVMDRYHWSVHFFPFMLGYGLYIGLLAVASIYGVRLYDRWKRERRPKA